MKNKLQIYCQRNKIDLPTYTHVKQHDGKWVSTVTFSYGTHQGQPFDKKTQADISAADKAIKSLNLDVITPDSHSQHTNIINCKKYRTIVDILQSAKLSPDAPIYVLVDYENVNKLNDLHYVFANDDNKHVVIYKFLGYSHHNVDSPYCSHIIKSGGSDAVDHAISMFTGILLSNWMHNKQPLVIIVLTRDLFAERLSNFTRAVECPSVYHVPTEAQCIEVLKERGFTRTNECINWN